MSQKKLVVLFGPTGVGKSDLGLWLAEQAGLPICYFEPVLAYRELTIGSAKPSTSDQSRVKHIGVDLTTLKHPVTLMDMYSKIVPQVITLLESRGCALVVTGSGFFMRALLQGVPHYPERSEDLISKETIFKKITGQDYDGDCITQDQRNQCYSELKDLWPKRAELLHPNDNYRVLRSLEVASNMGPQTPELFEQTRIEGLGTTSILPPECELHLFGVFQERTIYEDRLKIRIRKMMEQGFLQEVTDLLDYPLQGALKSVGYREAYAYLRGGLPPGVDLDEAVFRAHRQLARKQMKWFGKREDVVWLNHTRFDVPSLGAFIFQNVGKPFTMKL